jgi:hypothetical protein
MRIKPLPREKAAIILLRKHGYTMNQLSEAFGRSTSFIHRVLRNAIMLHSIHSSDLRKLPHKHKLFNSVRRWMNLYLQMPNWETWILGEEERPP